MGGREVVDKALHLDRDQDGRAQPEREQADDLADPAVDPAPRPVEQFEDDQRRAETQHDREQRLTDQPDRGHDRQEELCEKVLKVDRGVVDEPTHGPPDAAGGGQGGNGVEAVRHLIELLRDRGRAADIPCPDRVQHDAADLLRDRREQGRLDILDERPGVDEQEHDDAGPTDLREEARDRHMAEHHQEELQPDEHREQDVQHRDDVVQLGADHGIHRSLDLRDPR